MKHHVMLKTRKACHALTALICFSVEDLILSGLGLMSKKVRGSDPSFLLCKEVK